MTRAPLDPSHAKRSLPVRWLQLFGERCSGTNFVAQLLRRNAWRLSPTDRFGWKHGFVDEVRGPAEDTAFLLVVRDPFDWAQSLWRQPWHAAAPLRDATFSDFLRMEWHCEWGRDMELAKGDPRIGSEMLHERDPATGERFVDILALRAAKLRAHLSLRDRVRRFSVAQYERVAAEPRAFCREFCAEHGIARWPWFRPVRTFKGGTDPFVPKPREPMRRDDVLHIASRLDAALEREVGYDVAARCRELLAEA
jgi:hypothetical protein